MIIKDQDLLKIIKNIQAMSIMKYLLDNQDLPQEMLDFCLKRCEHVRTLIDRYKHSYEEMKALIIGPQGLLERYKNGLGKLGIPSIKAELIIDFVLTILKKIQTQLQIYSYLKRLKLIISNLFLYKKIPSYLTKKNNYNSELFLLNELVNSLFLKSDYRFFKLIVSDFIAKTLLKIEYKLNQLFTPNHIRKVLTYQGIIIEKIPYDISIPIKKKPKKIELAIKDSIQFKLANQKKAISVLKLLLRETKIKRKDLKILEQQTPYLSSMIKDQLDSNPLGEYVVISDKKGIRNLILPRYPNRLKKVRKKNR